ncbi:unnamed protein product [Cylindrotheca closterium]|uniref:Uncharacterized protein n=1 Tax=Cylindrotheca closterium TaxID=2856 RepID=A0AAD2FQL3_9STRA|nr:unnamed protein product [Cylindrotheca closterium]
MKFHPLTRGNITEFSFDEVKKTLVIIMSTMKMDHIDDMIQSVQTLSLFDIESGKPTLVLVTNDGNPDKDIKNEERRTNYLADQKDWKARKNAFDNNKRNFYRMIMKMCTDHMVDKLEREADFENNLFNDPVELLMRFKKFLTITVDTEWEYFGMWKTMSNLINCHQKEKENIASFCKRFEERAMALQALLHDDFLDTFTEKSQEYGLLGSDAEWSQHKKEESWERFMANQFLYNSNRAKYQSRIDGMTAQYTLKHLDFKQRCTFPTTLENAAGVLNQHKHNNRKKNSNGGNSNGQGKQNKSNDNQNDGAQFLQQQTQACFVCRSKDHVAPQCADKLKPRDKWKTPDKYRDYFNENGCRN